MALGGKTRLGVSGFSRGARTFSAATPAASVLTGPVLFVIVVKPDLGPLRVNPDLAAITVNPDVGEPIYVG